MEVKDGAFNLYFECIVSVHDVWGVGNGILVWIDAACCLVELKFIFI